MPSTNGSMPKNKVTAAVGTPAIPKTDVITITVKLTINIVKYANGRYYTI